MAISPGTVSLQVLRKQKSLQMVQIRRLLKDHFQECWQGCGNKQGILKLYIVMKGQEEERMLIKPSESRVWEGGTA